MASLYGRITDKPSGEEHTRSRDIDMWATSEEHTVRMAK